MRGKWTVLYDGYCNLCSRAVQWILRNDRAGRFRLVPLQEEREEEDPETVLLMRDGKVHSRSTAVLLIASRLRFPWPLVTALIVIPRFLRDPVYNLIARKRKRWFGERDTCYLPPGSSGGNLRTAREGE